MSESGLYSLILYCRKPEATAFKRWITNEVLPTIRKIGRYALDLSPAEQLPAQAQMLFGQQHRQLARR
jgi:prophage antirepressor-like protein